MTRTLTAQAIATCDHVLAMARGKHVPEPTVVVTSCAGCLADLRRTAMHSYEGQLVCGDCRGRL